MAQAPARLPSHLLPRSKAPATSSSTASLDRRDTATPPPSLQAPQVSRVLSRTRAVSPSASGEVSHKQTITLIRRILCPTSRTSPTNSQPLNELLPPLTSSNEVDIQLYAIIAIIIKDFVYSWYSKITPDRIFVEEVVRIIAHCTRDLEQRLRRVNINSLLLDEVPTLVEQHIRAYRTAYHPQYYSPISSKPRELYHTLVSHPGFAPAPIDLESAEAQAQNERSYRQLLIRGVLAVLLPTEDLQNPCLRTLIADILGELILGKGIGGRACEGWLIWDGISKIVASIKGQIDPKASGTEIEVDTRSRLEKFGLLSDNKDKKSQARSTRHTNKWSLAASELFWRILQYTYMMLATIRFIIVGLIVASSAPPRSRFTSKKKTKDNRAPPMASGIQAPTEYDEPILAYSAFGVISELLELGWRMPWVVGTLSFVQWHLFAMQVGATDGIFDKFLYNLLNTYVFSPARVPSLLLTLRTSIFPNNSLGPARDVPNTEEQRRIKRQAAEALLDLVPLVVARRIFATEPLAHAGKSTDQPTGNDVETGATSINAEVETGGGNGIGKTDVAADDDVGKLETERETLIRAVEDILDVFGDSYMNKCMIFAIVELIIVRLVPEMQEKGVQELMEERGVFVGASME